MNSKRIPVEECKHEKTISHTFATGVRWTHCIHCDSTWKSGSGKKMNVSDYAH